jgi:hypothetical protein
MPSVKKAEAKRKGRELGEHEPFKASNLVIVSLEKVREHFRFRVL